MRLKQYINEAKELSSSKSEKWSGILYRATNSKAEVKAALGDGLYLTPDKEIALNYGTKIKTFQTTILKVLGTNSREYNTIRTFVQSDTGWKKYDNEYMDDEPLSQIIRLEAEAKGYDAIYGGTIFGIVIFNPKKTLKEIK